MCTRPALYVWLQVLDAGRIREYDEPYVLLQNQDGLFYQMVQQTGRAEAASLLHTAKQVTTPTFCPRTGLLGLNKSPVVAH